MLYVSTRGQAPALTFDEVLLTGLARDGGLYVPKEWPQLRGDQLRRFAERPYDAVAVEVMWPYVEGTLARPEARKREIGLMDEAALQVAVARLETVAADLRAGEALRRELTEQVARAAAAGL